ncbi:AzlC-like protein [Candidatus Competibacter denitrificans Run_A_D11]|uniref:AzlC-like protein n=1 Tax=Candidatus Competibacter denitrificans Run_A_D11 TaxID=1400863 RepID=W6MDN2_9GAMM|nr:AzlC family ABC transporter permease [Candidatus Competibacter denitrificans]CDI03158.1 AzlC-like protein [Candidatus Competibacter denitrificans Run_A_D11]
MSRAVKQEFWAGVRALAPLLVGVAPFGMIYGVLALANGLTPAAALAMSSILFAGSAQFLFCQLVGVGAPATVMVAEVGLLNLRHALYSAALAPRLAHLPRRWKLLLAYLLTDEAFAAISHREAESQPSPDRHWFYLGAGLALWGGWQLSTAVGVLLGARLPADWPLDFALPLTFIAIVVPLIRSRAMLLAAGVAGSVALLAAGLPFKLGLLAAALAGMAAGWWAVDKA